MFEESRMLQHYFRMRPNGRTIRYVPQLMKGQAGGIGILEERNCVESFHHPEYDTVVFPVSSPTHVVLQSAFSFDVPTSVTVVAVTAPTE